MRVRNLILALLVASASAGGCAAVVGDAGSAPASVSVPLDREAPSRIRVGALRYLGALDLSDDAVYGGLSGLRVSADGSRFVAISDLGKTVTGRLTYDPSGRLAGAADIVVRPLPLDPDDGYRGRRDDSEEIDRLPGGGWLVSLEHDHRILHYAGGDERPEGTPRRLPSPPGLDKAPPNGGIEALTVLADGRLLAIEEGDDNGIPERRAWVAPSVPRSATDWQPLTYRAAPRFRPTSAAGLPDGGALVLERRVSLLGGWASRIVYVPGAALRPGASIDGTELARLEPPLLVDNFEGIAVRRGEKGELLIYIVSDDNRSPLQRSYLALFSVVPADAPRSMTATR